MLDSATKLGAEAAAAVCWVEDGPAASETATKRFIEMAILAHAYAEERSPELLREALAVVADTGRRARLTYDEKQKLQVLEKKTREFLELKRPGQNDVVMQYVAEAFFAFRNAAWVSFFDQSPAPTPQQHREVLVEALTTIWCRFTGDSPQASPNRGSSDPTVEDGDLHATPLVRFVTLAMESKFPGLTPGEILRGVNYAKSAGK